MSNTTTNTLEIELRDEEIRNIIFSLQQQHDDKVNMIGLLKIWRHYSAPESKLSRHSINIILKSLQFVISYSEKYPRSFVDFCRLFLRHLFSITVKEEVTVNETRNMYSNGKGIIDLASKMTLIQSRILRENIELVSTSNAFDKRRLLSLGNICLSSPKSFRDSAFIINYVITSIQESSNTEDYENFIVRLVMERRDIFTSLEESRQRAIFSKFPSILEYYILLTMESKLLGITYPPFPILPSFINKEKEFILATQMAMDHFKDIMSPEDSYEILEFLYRES